MTESYTYYVRSTDTTNRTGSSTSSFTYTLPLLSTLPTDVERFELTSFFRTVESDTEPNTTITVNLNLRATSYCFNQGQTAGEILLHAIPPTSIIGTSPDPADYIFVSSENDWSNMVQRPMSNRVEVIIRTVNSGARYDPPNYILALSFRPIRD